MYEINYIKIIFNNIFLLDLVKCKKFELICLDFFLIILFGSFIIINKF